MSKKYQSKDLYLRCLEKCLMKLGHYDFVDNNLDELVKVARIKKLISVVSCQFKEQVGLRQIWKVNCNFQKTEVN